MESLSTTPPVSPAINGSLYQELRGRLEQIRQQELNRHLKKAAIQSPDLLETVTTEFIERIASLSLALAQSEEPHQQPSAQHLARLFDLPMG